MLCTHVSICGLILLAVCCLNQYHSFRYSVLYIHVYELNITVEPLHCGYLGDLVICPA